MRYLFALLLATPLVGQDCGAYGTPISLRQLPGAYYCKPLAQGSGSVPNTTSVLKGNNIGGILAATPGTDYQLPLSVVNDTNVTGSVSGGTFTLAWAGTLAKARIISTAVYNDQSNTWSTGTQDFTAAAHFLPKHGAAASKPATCGVGEVYSADDATAGQNWYFCTALNTWTQQLNSGGGGGGTGNAAALVTLSFSATPTFTCPSSSAGTVVDFQAVSNAPIVLTGNITSSTLASCTAGALLNFLVKQDGTGGRTITMPTGFDAAQVHPAANVTTKLTYYYDGANGRLISSTSDAAYGVGVESSAPGTPPASECYPWLDSTNHVPSWKCNNASTVIVGAIPKAIVSHSFLNLFSVDGTFGVAQPAVGDLQAVAADTVLMNPSGSSAAPIASAMPTCTAGADIYNTSTHAWSCVSFAVPVPTPGTTITLSAPSGVAICTGTCTVTVPVPAAGYQFCVWNDDNVSTAITLAALGSSAMYENSARTAYGTAGTGTLVLSAAAANKVCIFGRDATHYQTVSYNGAITVN